MADRDAFDLFAFLGQLNRRDLQAYDKLTEDGKKAASPLVIMRWLTGTSDQAQIVRINTFANRYIFSLPDKALLFKLLAASCTGKTNRTNWIKGPTGSSTKLSLEAIKAKYKCSTREAEEYLPLLDAPDVIEFAEQAGWEKDQLKKLELELNKDADNGPGKPAKASRKPKK